MIGITAYSERELNKDELITKLGEDAHPYVNQNGLFVADGLGGSAGIRIVQLDPVCFDPMQLTEAIVNDRILNELLGDDNKEQKANLLQEYVLENFNSLFTDAMKTIYENVENYGIRLKKSGYIGSHALGVLMACYLIGGREKGQEFDENYFQKIARSIPSLYQYVIDTILVAEVATTKLNKVDLFGTTLSAAFFSEREEDVDVYYLNSGDSRSYVLDEQGFRQACDDQGKNGGMTNFMSTNGLQEIKRVCVDKKSYNKPVLIMSMTDGAYEAAHLDSQWLNTIPMPLEYTILNNLSKATNIEEAQQLFKDYYDKHGKIDDSNSIAIAAFGFESYEELRGFAERRIKCLEERFSPEGVPSDFIRVKYFVEGESEGDTYLAHIISTDSEKAKKYGEQQKKLIEEYKAFHFSEVSEEKLLDVTNNGWQ